MEECNMRLCTIVFPESSSLRPKEYTFKIPNMPYVREGDILRNPNYGDAPMKVVRVFDYPVNNVYNGYILKELLPIDTQVETPSTRFNNHQTSNNMEIGLKFQDLQLRTQKTSSRYILRANLYLEVLINWLKAYLRKHTANSMENCLVLL